MSRLDGKVVEVTKTSTEKLTGVPETLLYPLYMRYREARMDNGELSDQQYREIVDRIDYDFSELEKLPIEAQLSMVHRTLVFDERTREYIRRNPGGIVVNLGAGLDFRFERVDNGAIRWVDIDLPPVMELRRELYKETERRRFITASVLDYSWIDGIPENRNVFFIAEGLLPYLEPEDVKHLLQTISNNFADSEMIFDASSRDYHNGLKNSRSPFRLLQKIHDLSKWSLDHGSELESWDPKIRFLQEFYPLCGLVKRMPELIEVIEIIKRWYRVCHIQLGKGESGPSERRENGF